MADPLRIAFFTETFLPKIDGIVNTLCYLLNYLARQGHASLMFAPHGASVRYAATPLVRLRGFAFPLYPELKLVPPTVNVMRELRAFRPDLVHVVNPITLGLAGMRQARRLGVPVVASYHTDVPGYAARWGMGMLAPSIWRLFREIYNQADLTLCPSQATLDELRRQGFHNLHVWTRGVDATRFHPRQRDPAWRARLSGGHPEAPLLLYVGRLSPEKRVEWLLPLLTAVPQARLAIVGDGPAREKLAARFAGAPAVFTGYLRGADLARAYAAADLFVFPSANETLGNVLLEAMASGLPVVAARAGGPLDIVTEGQTGLLFAPDNQAEWITAVTRLVQDPTYARWLGGNGRARAVARGWDNVFDLLIEDYLSVMRTARRHPRGQQPMANLGQRAWAASQKE
jgi:phosphatidylinositol alpha 1,6-mannosyltransferase